MDRMRYIDFKNYNVVKILILNRWELEAKKESTDLLNNSGWDNHLTTEDIVCIYVSLDGIIKECNFSKKRSKLLSKLFAGIAIVDMDTRESKVWAKRRMLDRMILDINKKAEELDEIGGLENDDRTT